SLIDQDTIQRQFEHRILIRFVLGRTVSTGGYSYDEKNGTHCYDSQSNQHSQRGCKYRFEELFHNVLCNCYYIVNSCSSFNLNPIAKTSAAKNAIKAFIRAGNSIIPSLVIS